MKITKVEPLHIGQFMFARIETDEGINGVGEAGAWGHIAASGTAIERFGEYLVGKDPAPIEHHWNVMHRFSYFQGLAVVPASIRRFTSRATPKAPMSPGSGGTTMGFLRIPAIASGTARL